MSSLWRYFANFFRKNDTSLPLNPLLSTIKYQKVLGEGSFGIVLKAIDPTETEEQVPTAVKFLFPTSSNDLKLTARECEITKNLQKHDNIVQILAFVATKLHMSELVPIFHDCSLPKLPKVLLNYLDKYDSNTVKTICIQQELCGENLRYWLNHPDHNNRHDPSIQNVQITIIQNLITGLKYLHDNKIIHRDLNPNNVMFSGENFKLPVKIGDFGLSRIIHSSAESQTGSLTLNVGTRVYQAPEVSCGKYSYQADLFSLGLVIWEVAQLIRLADRTDLLHQYFDHDKVNVIEDNSLIPGVRELITNLIKKKVEDRIQSVDHVVRICESWEQNVFSVKTDEELTFWLQNIRPGCKILLWDGVYEGNFVLRKDNVEIVGQGGGTIFISKERDGTCLEIVGNRCTVSGLKIIATRENKSFKLTGGNNTITDMEFVGGNESLSVTGDENHLTNLSISNANCGLTIDGCMNTIKEIKFEEIGLWGIHIVSNSKHNTLSNITGNQLKIGILLAGSNNHVSDVNFVMENDYLKIVKSRVSAHEEGEEMREIWSGGSRSPTMSCFKIKKYKGTGLPSIEVDDICLSISGDENILDNLRFSRGSNGIRIKGRRNTVGNVEMENLLNFGIEIGPHSNTVNNLNVANVVEMVSKTTRSTPTPFVH